MEMKLADNIRRFRKEKSLTQEQLAEVLGVTPGAVYKWEAKLSVPELGLIMEMADFFDTSVDVLIGYEMKDNRLLETVRRLKQFRHDKDREGLSEAEKALKKYPNSFEIVYESASIYRSFGLESGRKEYALKSLELLEKSLLLISQNEDPEIGELTINGNMAEVYQMLGDRKKALELMKRNNIGGHYCDRIGLALTDDSGSEEAVPYLSESLVLHIIALVRTVMGYLNVYVNRGDFEAATELMGWGTATLSGLRRPDTPSYLDKINSLFFACMAYARLRMGDEAGARECLKKAGTVAQVFDAAPNYDGVAVKFVEYSEIMSAYDDLGATATDGIEAVVKSFENVTLSAMWKEVRESLLRR